VTLVELTVEETVECSRAFSLSLEPSPPLPPLLLLLDESESAKVPCRRLELGLAFCVEMDGRRRMECGRWESVGFASTSRWSDDGRGLVVGRVLVLYSGEDGFEDVGVFL
jgi:hypothetical protein